MGKVFSGGIEIATGFKVSNPNPIADYMVVENISDLSGLTNQFIGMTTFVLEDENIWVKKNDGWAVVSIDQNNIVKRQYVIVHNVNYDLTELVNALNTFNFNVEEFEIPLIIAYHLSPNGLFIYKYLITVKGKGLYGPSGYELTVNDLELINSDLATYANIVDNPTTDVITILDLSGLTLSNFINLQDPPYTFQNQADGYTIINVGSGSTETSFLFIGSGGTYGLNTGQTTPLDFQLLNDGIQADGLIVGTYNQIKFYKDNSVLKINQKYLITDYRTEYIIDNSETGSIEQEYTSIGFISSYAQFPIDVAFPVGTSVILTGLPDDYVGPAFVGMSGTVSTVFGTQYYIFSGSFPELTGMSVRFIRPRYSSEFHNKTILDGFGNVMMKPEGVINTDVHIGNNYSDMLASENPTVPIEGIIVTANSNNSFELNAKSNTHYNDILEYDFDDNEVKNSNGIVLKSRTGFIKRRINTDLNISINKDWRVQRYRRYKMSSSQYDLMKREESLYQVIISGQTTPYMGGLDIGSYSNTANTYSLIEVENANFWLDFTSGGTVDNVFVSGSSVSINNDIIMSELVHRFSSPFNLNEIGLSFKDFFIIPINSGGTITNINTVDISSLENTVFLNNNSSFGVAGNHTLKINDITNSTIGTTSTINSTGTITRLISYDFLFLRNDNIINSIINLSLLTLTNYGTLFNVTFGGCSDVPGAGNSSSLRFVISSDSYIYNSIFASILSRNVTFNQTYMNSCQFLYLISHFSNFKINAYLTSIKGPIGGFTNPITNNYSTYSSTINITPGFLLNPNKTSPNRYGWSYEIPKVSDKTILTKTNNSLYYNEFDEFDAITIQTISTPS